MRTIAKHLAEIVALLREIRDVLRERLPAHGTQDIFDRELRRKKEIVYDEQTGMEMTRED